MIACVCRSRTLRTPANLFIINLAITDFLMCATQAPIFFTTSMHKRWIFGEKGTHTNVHARFHYEDMLIKCLKENVIWSNYELKQDQSTCKYSQTIDTESQMHRLIQPYLRR